MKVLVTGKNGQLGSELQKSCPNNIDLVCFGSQELDIANAEQVNELLIAHSPDIVINAAAYTAVDKAETLLSESFGYLSKFIISATPFCISNMVSSRSSTFSEVS